ncbi:MAG TPA: response regulator [Bryobacteraceae bacterium]|jgi:CheY-like chemotaxis protein|nr:response regulator [Bryobacteraceae bacterium]
MSKLVLIVEDSETCAETLLIALESLPGIEARVIRSPRAAMAAMHDPGNDVAALVTDLNLGDPGQPLSTGFDLIRKLRDEPRFACLPILLISGDSDPTLPERALAQGANAFFPKPYSPSAVRRKLEQLIC